LLLIEKKVEIMIKNLIRKMKALRQYFVGFGSENIFEFVVQLFGYLK
jgi:hypothetical protein